MPMIEKPTRWESEKYLKFVRGLDCAWCGSPADHAHHLIGVGNMGGMGTKAPDWASMPLCAYCHNMMHRGVDQALLEGQWELIVRTLGRAIDEGVLK